MPATLKTTPAKTKVFESKISHNLCIQPLVLAWAIVQSLASLRLITGQQDDGIVLLGKTDSQSLGP